MKPEPSHPSPHSNQVRLEDALKHLHECEENRRPATAESLAGTLGISREFATQILSQLVALDWAHYESSLAELTPPGRHQALQILRRHRLYETYLAQETGLPATDWHRRANAAEHHLGPAETDALAERLNHPRYDPHGDPIPTRDGTVHQPDRVPLHTWPVGTPAQIAHVEDEPEGLFQRLERLRLRPSMILRVAARHPDHTELLIEGNTVHLPHDLVHLIQVTPVRCGEPDDRAVARLSTLKPGDHAVIRGLSPACVGAERRRLLDLGVVPGTAVHCEFRSPFGSPVTYRVRGTLLALRREQADRVLIEPEPAPLNRCTTTPLTPA